MSRPSFRPTKDQRKLVQSLAALGLRQEQIATMVEVRSPKTLRKHFPKEILRGTAEANATIAAAAYEMATSGKYPGMTRFWLRTVGGGPTSPFDNPAPDDSGADEITETTDADD